ncbi:MAG: hypothetical protein PHP02_05485 [Eubacteriales bacterium]|nr:hypothetical protein [Eubacteriales bacterium]
MSPYDAVVAGSALAGLTRAFLSTKVLLHTLTSNLPCIIARRDNRPRAGKMLVKMKTI